MTDREKLVALIKEGECGALGREDCSYCKYDGEDDCSYQLLADVLLANGVVVREKGKWESYWDDAYLSERYRCIRCKEDAPSKAETMHDQLLKPFCPNCGADMRKGENG